MSKKEKLEGEIHIADWKSDFFFTQHLLKLGTQEIERYAITDF